MLKGYWPIICKLLVLVLYSKRAVEAADDGNKQPIFFSFLTSKTGSFIASGSIPMIEYALEEINNSTDILQNYTLKHGPILDSKCNEMVAVETFMQQFLNASQPVYLALIGSGCSVATIPVAELSHYWNIPHMAFAAAANVLSDKSRFKTFLQILPSFNHFSTTLASISVQFGWRQLAIITEQHDLFTGVTVATKHWFKVLGLTLDDSIMLDPSGTVHTETIFNWADQVDHRIIFINTYSGFAYQILCEAYRRNMLYPKYVWITIGGYNEYWWLSHNTPECPSSHVETVLNGSLAIIPEGYFIYDNDSYTATSGLKPKEFTELYQRLLDMPQYQQYRPLSVIGDAYDTMWLIGLGLEKALQRVAVDNDDGCESLPGELVPLENFNYTNQKMGCVLFESMADVKFNGITGPFEFESNKSRSDNIVLLRQYRMIGGTLKTVPVIKVINEDQLDNTEITFSNGETPVTLWSGGIPYDGFADQKIQPIHPALTIIYYILASAGTVFAGICFVFNTLFRNRKVVKLSSPDLNYIVIAGSVTLYIAVYFTVYSFTGFDQATKQTVICNLQVWMFALGYSLCFSVFVAKSWRVYYIFSNPHMKKKAIKDWMLLIIVAVLVGIDVLILFIGTAIPASRITAEVTKDSVNPHTITPDGILENNYIYLCHNGSGIVIRAVTYGYEIILQLVAIFLAFHTRHVKIKALNDSKQISAIIYINSITLAVLVVSGFTLTIYRDIYATLEATTILIQATLFLGFLFVPNMIALYKDPHGENILKSQMETQQFSNIATADDLVAKLTARIKQLERKLSSTDSNVLSEFDTMGVIEKGLNDNTNGNNNNRLSKTED